MHIKLEQGIRGCQIITDTYDNDLAGIKSVLQWMVQQNPLLNKTLILAPVEPMEQDPSNLYHELAHLLQSAGIHQLIGIGSGWKDTIHYLDGINIGIYENTAALLSSGLLNNLQQAVIAFKYTKNEAWIPLEEQLYERCHQTVLEVNLDAVQHNLQFFRSKLKPDTQVFAMVKALSYGSSDYEVAQILADHGVDYLAVAYTDEGVALRAHGIRVPIMVMSPMPGTFHQLISHQLEPVLYSLESLTALHKFLLNKQASIKVHIEVETGMHRLGLGEQDLKTLIQVLQATPAMRPTSVMSQLAATGTVQHDPYTHAQARLFQQYAQQIETALGITLQRHLLNTAGILRFPEYQFNMVRLGIGLYGVGIDPAFQKELQVASRLKTTLIQIKQVPAAATVGYERKGVVQENKRVATLAIGYADGFSRAFGNGRGQVWINGQLASVIGHVCMDMVMVDVTHIDAKPGDEVIIFGPEHPIAQVAASIDTIPYELLTQVGERVRRVYYTS